MTKVTSNNFLSVRVEGEKTNFCMFSDNKVCSLFIDIRGVRGPQYRFMAQRFSLSRIKTAFTVHNKSQKSYFGDLWFMEHI
jgi:hypothetical protein